MTVVIAGDYGKPRPALVVQADAFCGLDSLTVLQLTSDLHYAPPVRIDTDPTQENGLRTRSQIMIDKAVSVRRGKVGARIGRLDSATLRRVDRALAQFLDLE